MRVTEKAMELLTKGKEGRPDASTTVKDGVYYYHNSPIIQYSHPTIIASLRGFNTKTTRLRVNEALFCFGILTNFSVLRGQLYFGTTPVEPDDVFTLSPGPGFQPGFQPAAPTYLDTLIRERDGILTKYGSGVRPAWVSAELATLEARIEKESKQ